MVCSHSIVVKIQNLPGSNPAKFSALVEIYGALNISYLPSPSSLIHTMDPLLFNGVVTRCVAGSDSLVAQIDFAGSNPEISFLFQLMVALI